VSVPSATTPPLPLYEPEQAVPDVCDPTLKVMEGLIEADTETVSSETIGMANDPLMPDVPTPVATVTVFDPEEGLVPVKDVKVRAPAAQAVLPEVKVKTVPALQTALAVPPATQVTAPPVVIAEKPVKVMINVPVLAGEIAVGMVMLKVCVTPVALAISLLKISFMSVGEAAKAAPEFMKMIEAVIKLMAVNLANSSLCLFLNCIRLMNIYTI
jgi:hypothetical protein